ncbi:MAG: toll/interleukin-1 receptor domain-containing protein [Flavobacteriaceae bacterium]|nr:toll/interleukin-1 receptor domain-containing protein [Flavobacteriaceae bacterium]
MLLHTIGTYNPIQTIFYKKMDQYNAFISYSHDDSAFAERISKRLRRYRAPKKTGLHKKLKVFRDVERLTANSDLSDALTERLKASEKLILLCSPSAATSQYVDEEVTTFMNLKGYDELLFIVCRGSFEEGIPPRLLKEEEPLFIDLSNANKKQFRDETLRLIAALYGVDYAKLYREDEKLRRRKQSTVTLTLFILLFLIFSGFLITSTQPETWERTPQPILNQDFMPIHEFAVNEEDPSIILYEGHDAKWGMNPQPEGYTLFPNSTFFDGDPDFNQYLMDFKTDPLVRIRFQLTNREGSGEVDIYGILNNTKNQLHYYRSLKFNGITKDSIRKQILIPPSMESITTNPYSLSPWPVDTLQEEGLYREWDTVEGVLINLLRERKLKQHLIQNILMKVMMSGLKSGILPIVCLVI